uniref:Uncharacterized protein n=1 Tax=Micrurus lemniscatus lemniscatus TaxID=129467 RepID=A0A2D4J4K9_MICLE
MVTLHISSLQVSLVSLFSGPSLAPKPINFNLKCSTRFPRVCIRQTTALLFFPKDLILGESSLHTDLCLVVMVTSCCYTYFCELTQFLKSHKALFYGRVPYILCYSSAIYLPANSFNSWASLEFYKHEKAPLSSYMMVSACLLVTED